MHKEKPLLVFDKKKIHILQHYGQWCIHVNWCCGPKPILPQNTVDNNWISIHIVTFVPASSEGIMERFLIRFWRCLSRMRWWLIIENCGKTWVLFQEYNINSKIMYLPELLQLIEMEQRSGAKRIIGLQSNFWIQAEKEKTFSWVKKSRVSKW